MFPHWCRKSTHIFAVDQILTPQEFIHHYQLTQIPRTYLLLTDIFMAPLPFDNAQILVVCLNLEKHAFGFQQTCFKTLVIAVSRDSASSSTPIFHKSSLSFWFFIPVSSRAFSWHDAFILHDRVDAILVLQRGLGRALEQFAFPG